ncbi:DUF4381 domain-containing protein [Vibrio sp. YMD68]|uniref:DUF4381 domain-containing protein n=1 Tax=Vibrio sp. YMD68 TaxID=3042300 RepID=UPI00249B91CC|nr:DUF4381 domain-containing protein [Vibrio sp. YMD68]WGV99409.1 DUF4381 domain-containing protein [Vibrio sp. YMD68]
MSIEHTPPSTYILRNLQDITIPESVRWFPQTIGWKIVVFALLLVALYFAYGMVRHWWTNRYRQEAVFALKSIDPQEKNAAERAFKVLKVVLRHLDSRNASLFGPSCLNQLNAYQPSNKKAPPLFTDELSLRWMQSLIDPKVHLTQDQRVEVIQKSLEWIKLHRASVVPSSMEKGNA